MKMMILVLLVHFLADFVLQTDKMAKGKSTSNKWLSIHIGVYTLPLFIFGWKFALFNGACHWGIDFFTSRATNYLWQKHRVHVFFVVIGFDQLLLITAPTSAEADFGYRIYNADGSPAQQCGNGARCVAYYFKLSMA